MEVIDNLIKIIQKHQKTLPNVEPLEVDSEFESVLHDTDDENLTSKMKCITVLDSGRCT